MHFPKHPEGVKKLGGNRLQQNPAAHGVPKGYREDDGVLGAQGNLFGPEEYNFLVGIYETTCHSVSYEFMFNDTSIKGCPFEPDYEYCRPPASRDDRHPKFRMFLSRKGDNHKAWVWYTKVLKACDPQQTKYASMMPQEIVSEESEGLRYGLKEITLLEGDSKGELTPEIVACGTNRLGGVLRSHKGYSKEELLERGEDVTAGAYYYHEKWDNFACSDLTADDTH